MRELRQREPEVYWRPYFQPGEEAQIDFGDVGLWVVDGVLHRTRRYA